MAPDIKVPNNFEIDQALKEFEAKSTAEQIQKTPETLKTSEVPKMVQFVIKYSDGAIKEQKQAEYVLLGFVVVAILVSFFLIFGGNIGRNKSPIYQEDLTPTARTTIPEDILKTIPYRNAK